jgi:hypothetical protein
MIIRMSDFLGMAPQLNPINMDQRLSQNALNTKLIYGNLRSWNALSATAGLTKSSGVIKTIYRWGENQTSEDNYWFSWTTDVDVVRAPIDADTTERTYFTGDGAPKVTDNSLATVGANGIYPNNAYLLGVPAPTTAPTAAVSGTATNAADVALSVAYVVTYVTQSYEESAPSPPSNVVSYKLGQQVNLTNIPSTPDGNRQILYKRIYRSNTGSKGTAYQFVAEVPVSFTTYGDVKDSAELGETVATWGWSEPPATMQGLKLLANGIGLGFSGNTLYPSEPFALYAYPVAYQLSTESPIVGIGVFGQSAFIGTKSNPYVITGAAPESLSMIKLEAKQACVSKRSIVEMNGGVVYASPDGLFLVNGNGISQITAGLLSREDWQKYVPSSIHAYEIDGRYIAFYDTGTVQGGLVFDLFSTTPSFTKVDFYATAGYSDRLRDILYLKIPSTTTVQKWEGGSSNLTFTWRSKKFRAPRPMCPAAARIEGTGYPFTFKLYVDDVLKFTKTVTSATAFRLPSAYKGQIFEMEFSGTGQINTVMLAESFEELRNV